MCPRKLTSFPRTLSSNWVSLKCTFVIRGLKNEADSTGVVVFWTFQNSEGYPAGEDWATQALLCTVEDTTEHPRMSSALDTIPMFLHKYTNKLRIPVPWGSHSSPIPSFLPFHSFPVRAKTPVRPGSMGHQRTWGWVGNPTIYIYYIYTTIYILLYSFHGRESPE